MNITDLNGPIDLSRQFSRSLSEYLRRGPDFGQADRSFGSMVSNPQLFMGPGGTALDPIQNQSSAATSYLGNRLGVSQANQQQKGNFADLLLGAGSNIGNLSALMQQLQAGQGYSGQSSALGGLGISNGPTITLFRGHKQSARDCPARLANRRQRRRWTQPEPAAESAGRGECGARVRLAGIGDAAQGTIQPHRQDGSHLAECCGRSQHHEHGENRAARSAIEASG